jgi:hypothetical protein
MKIKNDFITNSSSVNYIMGDYRKNKEEDMKVEMIESIKDMISLYNIKEVEEYIEENFEIKEYYESVINKMKEIIEKEGGVRIKCVHTSDLGEYLDCIKDVNVETSYE